MPLRNLPTDCAYPLCDLLHIQPEVVSSMSLTRNAGADITLLAFGAGESVSEERYFGDTLYYVLEGAAEITLQDSACPIQAGEVFKVEAGVEHGVQGVDGCAFKLLQITVS